MKVGLLKCREEPPKLLQGNKFQERTFQIKERKLLLLKDKKVALSQTWFQSQPVSTGSCSSILTALCCCSEHQTREGVVSEVHEDLRWHPQEAESSNQVTPKTPTDQLLSVSMSHGFLQQISSTAEFSHSSGEMNIITDKRHFDCEMTSLSFDLQLISSICLV